MAEVLKAGVGVREAVGLQEESGDVMASSSTTTTTTTPSPDLAAEVKEVRI